MRILFIGDIVGKVGRRAVAKVLPSLKKSKKLDFVIANVENLAHGKGVTKRTLEEMRLAGIDCFTSGNHVWRNKEIFEILSDKDYPLVCPANYPGIDSACGYQIFNISQKRLIVLNLQGRVFMPDLVDNPFLEFDSILKKIKPKDNDIVLVDFHAETTSEKAAFGHYADGRVQAVLGTHTHVQTADEGILPEGTAFITDVGFVGGKNTSLGVELEGVIKTYLTGLPARHEIPEIGPTVFNSVLLEIDKTKATKITRLNKEVTIK